MQSLDGCAVYYQYQTVIMAACDMGVFLWNILYLGKLTIHVYRQDINLSRERLYVIVIVSFYYLELVEIQCIQLYYTWNWKTLLINNVHFPAGVGVNFNVSSLGAMEGFVQNFWEGI